MNFYLDYTYPNYDQGREEAKKVLIQFLGNSGHVAYKSKHSCI